MIVCPFCSKDFIAQCGHLLCYVDGQGNVTGTDVLRRLHSGIELAILDGVRRGYARSPVPELAAPYHSLRDALSAGRSECDAMIYAFDGINQSLQALCKALDSSIDISKSDPHNKILVPHHESYLHSSSKAIRNGLRYEAFVMSAVYWSRNREVTNQLMQYQVGKWASSFSKPPSTPEFLGNYFPVTAETELNFPAETLNRPPYLIPWDSSPDAVLRTLRIALRAVAEESGPLIDPDTQFLWRLFSSSDIHVETAVRIMSDECPTLLNAALPVLKRTASEAARRIPTIRNMLMSDMCRAHRHQSYEGVIRFVKFIESHLPTLRNDSLQC